MDSVSDDVPSKIKAKAKRKAEMSSVFLRPKRLNGKVASKPPMSAPKGVTLDTHEAASLLRGAYDSVWFEDVGSLRLGMAGEAQARTKPAEK